MPARIRVAAVVRAPPEVVWRVLADYREHHPRILPRPPFEDLVVEHGGTGAGTVIRVALRVGGRTRESRMRVSEPAPGRVLVETDEEGTSTTFTLEPQGDATLVEILTLLSPKRGVAAVVERLFAPPFLRRVYREELANLDAYATRIAPETTAHR